MFDYAEFTTRNLGFVSRAEQERLCETPVFVCGTGGMGGACLLALVRAGFERIGFADFDTFEVSNLNRQVFANLDAVGREKTAATREQLLKINPHLEPDVHGADWTDRLDELLPRYRIVVNGMDDLAAGVQLYRKAREHGATVIDAYTAPLPSVTVVAPADPRPEERLGFPVRTVDWRDIHAELAAACVEKELVYVLTHSNSAAHVDHDIAAEMVAGKRKRISFAPMVIATGMLMAFEVVNLALARKSGTDYRGYFFNPWTAKVERPRSFAMAAARGWLVKRFLASVLSRE